MTETPPSPPPAAPSGPEQPPAPPARSASLRLGLWILLSAALVAGTIGWFYFLRQERLLARLPTLHAGWLALSGACLAIWLLLVTTPRDALRLSPRLGKRIVIGLTLILCCAGVAWVRPVLSPEVLRYRFDGRIWLLGLSPYTVSPQHAAARAADAQDPDLRPDELDLAAPNPTRTTLNLPASQLGFIASRTLEYLSPPAAPAPSSAAAVEAAGRAGLSSGDWRVGMLELAWWRQLFVWRCILAGVLLLTVAEMIAWLRHRGLSPWWVVAFAWQPLVLVETLGAGHQDLLGVLFLVAGLRRADNGNFRRAGICLAVSAAVKPLALLALPFVIRRAWAGDPPEAERLIAPPPHGGAHARRAAGWFFAAYALLMSPIWLGGGVMEFLDAIRSFMATAEHGASFHRLLEAMFVGPDGDPVRAARVRLAGWLICGIVTLMVGAGAWARRVRPAAAFYAMSVAGLLLSPVASPWLLVWPLAVVPILRGRAGPAVLIWAGTAGLFYMPTTLVGAEAPVPALLWQFLPVYVVAIVELVTARRLRRAGDATLPPVGEPA